jgi:hypothetical protein
MSAQRKRLKGMIRRGEPITGVDAIRASKLRLGKVRRACNSELVLAPYSYQMLSFHTRRRKQTIGGRRT